MAKAYYTSYKLPIIITRGNNVYGPNQFPEKMIPKFTLLASRGEDLPVHGDGEYHNCIRQSKLVMPQKDLNRKCAASGSDSSCNAAYTTHGCSGAHIWL